MTNATDTLSKVTTIAQGAVATNSIITDPSIQNAIVQFVIVILTAMLSAWGKKKEK